MLHDSKQWYVMLHRQPDMIDFQLQRENASRRQGRRPSVEYFIPYCFLSRVSADARAADADEIRSANALRQDFHDFVFIHAGADDLSPLLSSSWNAATCFHLHHFRDYAGREVVISPDEMNLLIRVFTERRLKFSVGLPVPGVTPGEEVTVTEGLLRGQRANVLRVSHTASGISLTLGVSLFSGTRVLQVPDIPESAIRRDGSPDDLIGLRFIRESELTLLDILSRRVNRKETDESRRQDASALDRLFLYSYVTVSDPSARVRFLALMLLCASLRYDASSRDVLASQAESLLSGGSDLSPALRAVLNLSLFVATRRADYRSAAKQALRQLPSGDSEETLHRLFSLVKRMRSRSS